MAKILCITSGLTGILNASFELVVRLEKAGHHVIYASPKKVAERVGAQGIHFIALPEVPAHPERENLPSFRGPLKKGLRWKYKIKHSERRKKEAKEKINPIAFANLLDTEQPDLVIIDVELHEYIFKAYAKKIPLLLLSQWFSIWNRPGLPYLLNDTIPGKGWRGQPWAMTLSWKWIQLKRGYTFFKKFIFSLGTDRRSALLALAKREGFPLEWIGENYWPGPFTYDRLPVMSMTPQEMEFPHEERPNHFYIGPMVFPNRKERLPTEKERELLVTALEYKKRTGASLIYCSISTLSKGDAHFINKVIAAVKERKEWMLVIALGGLLTAEDLIEGANNIFPFSYVPQLEILREADCSINHGGIHTINECIHFKVPMLVYSGKRSDQNGCAARVAFHKLGIMADKDKDNQAEIQKKIDEVLVNPAFRQNVETMNRHCQKYKDEGFVEQIISGFLAKGTLRKENK